MASRSIRSLGASLAAVMAAVALASVPAPAMASSTMASMFEDTPTLLANPSGEMARLRLLGVTMIRFDATWSEIAPGPNSRKPPKHFNAADPASYPARNWAPFDAVIRAAQADGIQVNVDLDGALSTTPLWATGPGAPKTKTGGPHKNWEPNARMYGLFSRAVATRYSGTYVPAGYTTPLPRVSFWSIWNEPNYGPSLAPQALPGHRGVEFSPWQYRNLVDAAWSALVATGHAQDTVIFGEVAPRGSATFGVFNGMKPIQFLRALYCVDSRYRPLRGSAARLRGCPTTAASSRRFVARNPGLFQASGFSDHPYMRWYAPNNEQHPDPQYSSLAEIHVLERALDRVQQAYGSHKKLPVYNTEFGYLTRPPKHINPPPNNYPWPTQATAAYYLNWAEYISWRDPRIASFNQYLLTDPFVPTKSNDWGEFASGLLNYTGSPKPTYAAWRMPLYLPVTSTAVGQSLEVWGCVRPATFAALDTGQPQSAEIQFQPASGGPFQTLQTVSITSTGGCYLDLRILFPGTGKVRLMWTYPPADPLLSPPGSSTITSRTVQITLQ